MRRFVKICTLTPISYERYHHPSVGYYEHMPAWRVKTYLGDEIWNSYFKSLSREILGIGRFLSIIFEARIKIVPMTSRGFLATKNEPLWIIGEYIP